MHFEGLDGALRGVVVMDIGRDKITFTVPFLNYSYKYLQNLHHDTRSETSARIAELLIVLDDQMRM